MTKPSVTHIVPSAGCAAIVPALSVSLFFDALDETQLAGIGRAWKVITERIGARLSWYVTDAMPERRKLTTKSLVNVPDVLSQVAKKRPYYTFRAHGGEAANCMSPWAVDLWIDKPREIEGQERSAMSAIFGVESKTIGRIANCLRVSLPATDSSVLPSTLENLTVELVETMPLLHGNAGYALVFDDASPAFESEHWSALARLAMRHPGYDVLHYTAVRSCVYNKIKTVNWITVLGPRLAAAVDTESVETPNLQVVHNGDNLLIKAGAEPEIGDVNRGDVPELYQVAARRFAEITCFDQAQFGGTFDDELTQRWVRRFYED